MFIRLCFYALSLTLRAGAMCLGSTLFQLSVTNHEEEISSILLFWFFAVVMMSLDLMARLLRGVWGEKKQSLLKALREEIGDEDK